MSTLTFANILLSVTAAASVGSLVQNRKASKIRREQNRVSNRIAAIGRSRDVKQAIAARRIRTAEIQNLGFQLGVAGSTAPLGAVAGITSDTASSIGQSNLQFTGQEAISSLSNRISGLQSSASTFQSIASLGSLVGQPQNLAALTKAFGS